jgi:serine/threonine protein phosphatase PrpC
MGQLPNAARLERRALPVARALRAAGASDPGRQRDVNEDRLHCDVDRGVFAVIDGIGGQAAGGKAADVALMAIRARLERATGTIVDRIKEAIAIANNEVFRLGGTRAEWHGMACVLTVAVVDDDRAIVGHVGDTRLYKLTEHGIEKITRDHSPVGEREDSHQISEIEAMRHPRRNEVYRDVGSELHDVADPDFIEVHAVPFEPRAALLLCSDGLTDAVASTKILDVVRRLAGEPQRVVDALIDAANAAGGKDNITAVYVEGEQFADVRARERSGARRWPLRAALAGLAALAIVTTLAVWRPELLRLGARNLAGPILSGRDLVVAPGESIATALDQARAGDTIVVEPGDYRERLALRSGVRVVSRVPRGATIRLPGNASEADPAIVAADITSAEFAGFRIVGDAATPLGTGVLVRNSDVSIVDVDISGATKAAVEISGVARPSLLASDIRDNPGAALALRAGAQARIVHNVFTRNGLATPAVDTFVIEPGAAPVRATFLRENSFPDAEQVRPSAPKAPRGRGSR